MPAITAQSRLLKIAIFNITPRCNASVQMQIPIVNQIRLGSTGKFCFPPEKPKMRKEAPMYALLARTMIALLLLTSATWAEEIAAPQGEVILTISGKVAKTNSGDTAQIDRAMLEALPQQVISTTTPWHEGEVTFEGPYMRDVLGLVGGTGDMATVTALDDYVSEVPVATFDKDNPILAMKRNGEAMSDDDQGPLFIIYDYDSKPELNTEDYHGYSVWSVRTIDLQ